MVNKFKSSLGIVMLLLMCSLTLVSSISLEKKTDSVKLGDIYIIEQFCDNSTYSNISNIKLSSNNVLGQTEMIEVSNDYYQYNFTTTIKGLHTITFYCDENGVKTSAKTDFDVTSTGQDLNQGKANLYILIWIVSFLVMIGLIIFSFSIPMSNKKDEMTGYVLAISNLKYLKMLMLAFAYVFLVFLSYLTWMISYAYLDMEFLSTIFRFIFTFLAIATLPLFVLYAWINIANLVRDSNVADALSRGLRIT